MFLILLVYMVALTLETLGSYLSVVGLAAKTGPVLIMIAVTLDCSKIIIASVLYKRWKTVHMAFKLFFVPVLICLVLFTSTGTVGFLTKQLGNTNAFSEQQKAQTDSLQAEKEKLEARKTTIDNQITQLPATSVTARKRLTDLFSNETSTINTRLASINKELTEAQSKTLETRSENGTMASIASAWNIAPDAVVKIVALVLAIFIDPLAIALLSLANFLSEERKKELLKPKTGTASNNLWDKFKLTLFGNKSTFNLFNKNYLQAYTDSKGHLIKTKATLASKNFIQHVQLIETKIKPIHFDHTILAKHTTLIDFIQPDPVLIKSVSHLTPKRMIQKVFTFETVTEKLLNKIDDIAVRVQDTLTDKKTPIIIEKSILPLNVKEIISDSKIITIVNKKIANEATIQLVSQPILKEYISSVPSERIIEQLSPLHMIENITKKTAIHQDEPIVVIDKEDTYTSPLNATKPKPQTLPAYNNLQHEKGFFENGEHPRYIASNLSEDIHTQADYDYDAAIAFWENDDDNFYVPVREVLPIEIKGFNLIERLSSPQF